MDRFREFIKTSTIGGLAVVLPVAILLAVFRWVFTIVTDLIQPITSLVVTRSALSEFLADILVMAIITSSCFFLGVFVKTRLGTISFEFIERRFLQHTPGYKFIKETVAQFVGRKKAPFKQVVRAYLFDSKVSVTAFVTDEHDNGIVSLFIPTGPNITTGYVVHVPKDCLEYLDVPADRAMRTVIACGAGSAQLFEKGEVDE